MSPEEQISKQVPPCDNLQRYTSKEDQKFYCPGAYREKSLGTGKFILTIKMDVNQFFYIRSFCSENI